MDMLSPGGRKPEIGNKNNKVSIDWTNSSMLGGMSGKFHLSSFTNPTEILPLSMLELQEKSSTCKVDL